MSDPGSGRDLLEQLAEDFIERHRRGERPALTEYTDRHPELGDAIRDLFPALVKLEALKPGSGDPTGPFAPHSALAEGARLKRLGDYRILREVGRGGMGIVYEAEQESLGRHVALKVLPSGALLDPKQLGRFEREAKAAARLHHTNIVPVYGVGEANGLHYFVMQFIQGQGLDQVLAELRLLRRAGAPTATAAKTPLSAAAQGLLTGRFEIGEAPPDANGSTAKVGLPGPGEHTALSETGQHYYRGVARVGIQVAEALAHAHAQGTLHRDIKPSNLLLDAQGSVWVTDFGLAKADDGGDLTGTGEVVGTLRYIPPERFTGQSDGRGDVYALGLTLYELLTLRPAFDDDGRHRLIERILHEEPPRPRQIDPALPRDLETVVLKAIAKDPARRYQSASELADDLRRFVEDRPIRARRVTARERLWRWCRRNPGLAALAGLSLAASLAVVVVAVAFAIRASHDAEAIGHARDAIRDERDAAEEHQRRAERRLAENYLDQALAVCELEGDASRGLLQLVHALENTPGHAPDLERAIRLNLAAWSREVHVVREMYRPVAWGDRVLALSPDGKTVLTTGQQKPKEVQFSDLATGRPVGPSLEHEFEVSRATFSPDGLKVATAGGQRDPARHAVWLWDVATGTPRGQPLPHPNQIRSVAFSADGKSLLSHTWAAPGKPSELRLWETATGKQLGPVLRSQDRDFSAAAVSPDGKKILTGSGELAQLWEAATGKPIGPAFSTPGDIYEVEFSLDGKAVLIGSKPWAQLWDVTTGRSIGPPFLHSPGRPPRKRVALAPDGKTVLTEVARGTQLWETSTGRAVGPPLRDFLLQHLRFLPNGRQVLGLDPVGTVRLWEWAAAPSSRTVLEHPEGFGFLNFSPDRKTVLICDRGAVRAYDVATGKAFSPPLPREGSGAAMAFYSSSGETFLIYFTGRVEGSELQLWNAATYQPLGPPTRMGDRSAQLHLNPGATAVAAVARSEGKTTLRVWEVIEGRIVNPRQLAEVSFSDVAFHPDGKRVMTSRSLGEFRLWDVATGELVGPALNGPKGAKFITFHPDGRLVAIAGMDGTVQVWDVTTGQPVGSRVRHEQTIAVVSFSPDGQLLLAGSFDGIARLWDIASSKPVGPPMQHGSDLIDVGFCPDGKGLVTGGADLIIHHWPAPTPVSGSVERLKLWVHVITGVELDEYGGVRPLDAAAWQERRRRLAELGGPPTP
jgi:WD40 repeat protein/serine/threonine protein kinase